MRLALCAAITQQHNMGSYQKLQRSSVIKPNTFKKLRAGQGGNSPECVVASTRQPSQRCCAAQARYKQSLGEALWPCVLPYTSSTAREATRSLGRCPEASCPTLLQPRRANTGW